MAEKRKYDATVARIAGNILSGMTPTGMRDQWVWTTDPVPWAVRLAREIVAETKRTEPEPAEEPT